MDIYILGVIQITEYDDKRHFSLLELFETTSTTEVVWSYLVLGTYHKVIKVVTIELKKIGVSIHLDQLHNSFVGALEGPFEMFA